MCPITVAKNAIGAQAASRQFLDMDCPLFLHIFHAGGNIGWCLSYNLNRILLEVNMWLNVSKHISKHLNMWKHNFNVSEHILPSYLWNFHCRVLVRLVRLVRSRRCWPKWWHPTLTQWSNRACRVLTFEVLMGESCWENGRGVESWNLGDWAGFSLSCAGIFRWVFHIYVDLPGICWTCGRSSKWKSESHTCLGTSKMFPTKFEQKQKKSHMTWYGIRYLTSNPSAIFLGQSGIMD